MKTVHKWALMEGDNPIEMDRTGCVMHFGMQNFPTMWACVDTDEPVSRRVFRIFGTGHPVPDGYVPVASCFDGPFVWHLFERVTRDRTSANAG